MGLVCVRTADAGHDATGHLSDDDIWAAIFAWPYAAHCPDTAFVIEDDEGLVSGYIVGAPDTDAFEQWFHDEWWPPYAARWPRPADDDQSHSAGILRYAYSRGTHPEPFTTQYPAHLHIDMLPHLQGQGWGRRLVAALADRLRKMGVVGVHLSASADNVGAVAFYPRVGFTALPSHDGGRSFGMLL